MLIAHGSGMEISTFLTYSHQIYALFEEILAEYFPSTPFIMKKLYHISTDESIVGRKIPVLNYKKSKKNPPIDKKKTPAT